MTHVPHGLNDTFTHDVKVLGKLYGDGSGLSGISGATESINDLSDVDTTGISDNKIFYASSGNWVIGNINDVEGTLAVNKGGTGNASGFNAGDVIVGNGYNALATMPIASFALTAALTSHTGDSSDPHGETLTQTNLSVASCSRTGDVVASMAAYMPNVVFAPSSSAITVANYTQGTVFLIVAGV